MLILVFVYCAISVESTKLTAISNGGSDLNKYFTDDDNIDTTTTEAVDFLETVIGMIAGNYDRSMKSKKNHKCCCSKKTNQIIDEVDISYEINKSNLNIDRFSNLNETNKVNQIIEKDVNSSETNKTNQDIDKVGNLNATNKTKLNIHKFGNSNETKSDKTAVNVKSNSFNITANNTSTMIDDNIISDSSTHATTTYIITKLYSNEKKIVTTTETDNTRNEANENEDLLSNSSEEPN